MIRSGNYKKEKTRIWEGLEPPASCGGEGAREAEPFAHLPDTGEARGMTQAHPHGSFGFPRWQTEGERSL